MRERLASNADLLKINQSGGDEVERRWKTTNPDEWVKQITLTLFDRAFLQQKGELNILN